MLPTDAQKRKAVPVYTGFVKYFPDAMVAVAELSAIANEQHNPGQPVHWAKEKSTDEKDALMRHLIDDVHAASDTDGVLHATKVAWRAMANLQRTLEQKAQQLNKKVSNVSQQDICTGVTPPPVHNMSEYFVDPEYKDVL